MRYFFIIIGILLVGVLLASRFSGILRKSISSVPDVAWVGLANGDVFTGGEIRATAKNLSQRIAWARFEYQKDNQWREIDTDTGGIADSADRRDVFLAYWDIARLDPGTYRLRATMQSLEGAVGAKEIDVIVSVRPIPIARALPSSQGAPTLLDAGLSRDGSGKALVAYQWFFDDEKLPVTGSRITHTFPSDRGSLVLLTVQNSLGAEGAAFYIFRNGTLANVTVEELQAGFTDAQNDLLRIALRIARRSRDTGAPTYAAIRDADTSLEQVKNVLLEQSMNTRQYSMEEIEQLLQVARERIAAAHDQLSVSRDAPESEPQAEADELDAVLSDLTALHIRDIAMKANEISTLVNLQRSVYLLLFEQPLLQQEDHRDGLSTLDEIIRKLNKIIEDIKKAQEKLHAAPPDIKGAREILEKARAELKKCIEALAARSDVFQDPDHPDNSRDLVERLKKIYLELGVLIGKLWLLQEIGLTNEHADIPIPDITRTTDHSHYEHDHGKRDIQINRPSHEHPSSSDDVFDDSVLYHELDHHFLWEKNHQELEGGAHQYDEHLNRGHLGKGEEIAWSEGWADFSSAAKRKDPMYIDAGEEHATEHFTPEKDLENDQCKNTGEDTMHDNKEKGDDVEGSVAGILWDLFDGDATGTGDKDTDHDGVSIPFACIWKAINKTIDDPPPPHHPHSIQEFYKALTSEPKPCDVDLEKVNDIFNHHGVTVP